MTSPSMSFPWQPSNPWLRLPEANQLRFPETQPPRTAWQVGALQRELTASRKKETPPRQPSCWAWRNKIPSELYYKIAKRLKNINANSTFGFLSFFYLFLTRGIVGDIWYLGAFGLQFQSAMFTVHLNSTVVCSSKSMRQLASVFCFGRWWAITSMTGQVTTQQLFQVIILPAWTLQLQASDEITWEQIQISG